MITCCGWTREDYIKDRTQYWLDSFVKGRSKKKAALACAEEDWNILVEHYGLVTT